MILKVVFHLVLLSISACSDTLITISTPSVNEIDSPVLGEDVTSSVVNNISTNFQEESILPSASSIASGITLEIQGSSGLQEDDQIDNTVLRMTTPVTTQAVRVWGEVGRGIVAATPGYNKGELGRKPLLLTASRGRSRSGPYFEEELPPTNVTAPSGSTVYLDCRVAMLQDKVVTWAARKDDRLRLLTVGKQAYSADKRFSLSFRYPSNWRLQIQKATKADQGYYECQVAAHPPITRQIYLNVISPEISISDEGGRLVVERYYKSGSSLQLTCAATQLLQHPNSLAWWQGHNILSESSSCNVTGIDSAVCTLYLDQVSRSHAGTYTCGTFPLPQVSTTGDALSGSETIDGAAEAVIIAATKPPPPPAVFPSQQPDGSFVGPPFTHYTNASVAVHVLHGNLIGVAVLPNTGKSVGSNDKGYISLQKLVLGLMMISLLQNR